MILFWLEYCSIRSIYPSTNASVNVAMPSVADLAKRELVKVLRELAEKYGVVLTLTRDSAHKDIETAFRKVSRRAHPDKGGLLADFQKLSATNDTWRELLKNVGTPGRPKAKQRRTRPKAGKPWTVGVPEATTEFRGRGRAVLDGYPVRRSARTQRVTRECERSLPSEFCGCPEHGCVRSWALPLTASCWTCRLQVM